LLKRLQDRQTGNFTLVLVWLAQTKVILRKGLLKNLELVT